jgi:hypothetical protein
MRYALLVSHNENAVISQQEAARRAAATAAFLDDAQERGVLAGDEQLYPASTATTVRAWDGGDVMIGPWVVGPGDRAHIRRLCHRQQGSGRGGRHRHAYSRRLVRNGGGAAGG